MGIFNASSKFECQTPSLKQDTEFKIICKENSSSLIDFICAVF